MKQYLLLLKSGDFNKSGNKWTSNAINLYNNSQYTNYSYTRSRYGLNLIGDNTYVGTEITSPSYNVAPATPISDNVVYVTNLGEVVYESATPSLLRFVDTTSRIDVLAYKHTFTNLPGTEVPTFNIQMHEADSEDGPWLKSSLSFDSNVIFIRNCKPWIKIELDIFAENIDVNTLGLLFYLEIGIHNPTSGVISEKTRNVLKRFPTWMDMYADSENPATPSLKIPSSTAGKFLTAILQESIDDFDNQLNVYDINHYISSANEDMLAWAYVSYNVPVNILSVVGDGISLIQADSLETFYRSKLTDYIYYYNIIDKQIITLRQFNNLIINSQQFNQYPTQVFNDFDEFGLRMGLARLFLESNSRYKKRILDVSQNLPASNIDGFKRSVRRELDIWKAYGLDPDSSYLGATPDVVEIYDMQRTTPWFSFSGKPLQPFVDIIRDLNEKYPSNYGYVKWDEGYWDYGGMEGEGLSRLPAIYDVNTSASPQYYQPGVGDFSDGRFILESDEKATISFSGLVKLSGTYFDGIQNVYSPILIDYNWYLSYLKTVADPDAGRKKDSNDNVGVGLTYEIETRIHGQYPTPSTFYSNLNYLLRDDFYVGNQHLENHPASPEYSLVRVFNDDGYTVSSMSFKDKQYNNLYYNTDASPNTNSINFSDVTSVKIIFSNGGWDYVSSTYDKSLPTANYRASFSKSTPNTIHYVDPEYAASAVLSSPSFSYKDANVKIGSTVYSTKQKLFETQKIRSNIALNNINDLTSTGIQNYTLYTSTMLDRVLYPLDATPVNLYIDTVKPIGLPYFNGAAFLNDIYGGVTVDPYDGQQYLVPSSPNIIYNNYNSFGEKIGTEQYFDTATINYYATPSYIIIESATSNYYPIGYPIYTSFEVSSTPGIFSGYIDSLDNVYKTTEQVNNTFFNSDDFLDRIYIDKNSFNLDTNTQYYIKDVEIISDTNFVSAFVSNKDELISDIDLMFGANAEVSFDIRAKKDPQEIALNRSAIHTGWIYENNKEYYIYSDPVTETSTGRFFSIKLNNTPRSGSPIIVKVDGVEYRNAVLANSATPELASFTNLETIYANRSNTLYLAYENVSNVSVQDSYTGIILFQNLQTNSNQLDCFSYATPSIEGRAYYVEYDLNDSWYVDKNVYNPTNENYESYIYLSATPSTDSIYSVTYENSLNDNTLPIDLNINSSVNPIDEGFIYMSTKDYDFATAELKLSPSNVSNSQNDLMYLTIISYDSNNNFKPGQTFRITGELISATPEYVTTNNNGIASSIIRYAYTGSEYYQSGLIDIIGIGSSTPNGNLNSSNENFSQSLPFNININQPNMLKVKGVPSSLIVNTGQDANISLNGQMYWKGEPWKKVLPIAWNKARTLVDLFAATPDYISYTNSDGSFNIINAATAQDTSTPGYWFARVSVNNPDYVEQLLIEDNEIVSQQDLTISGDIMYWYESYDTLQYSEEPLVPLPNIYTSNRQQNSNIISTPNFVYNHSDSNTIIYNNSTPNWRPPRWVPLSRFDQYQMGILGSTPNTITNYDALHPDYEET